jgi:hypothetical protein
LLIPFKVTGKKKHPAIHWDSIVRARIVTDLKLGANNHDLDLARFFDSEEMRFFYCERDDIF